MDKYKIVIDLDVETADPDSVVTDFLDWYGDPGAGHQTRTGVDYSVTAVEVSNEGLVE